MRLSHSIAVALILIACSKKSDPPAGGGGATGGSGSAAAPAPAPAPAEKPAPAMTPELFVTEPTKFSIEGMDRGLWISDKGGPFEHKCRVELGMTMGRFGKLRGAAMKTPEAVKCEPRGRYTVCTYALPAGDTTTSPDGQASWVFVADDDSDDVVLMAVLFGAHDWASIEPKLPAKTPCPRPSANP